MSYSCDACKAAIRGLCFCKDDDVDGDDVDDDDGDDNADNNDFNDKDDCDDADEDEKRARGFSIISMMNVTMLLSSPPY